MATQLTLEQHFCSHKCIVSVTSRMLLTMKHAVPHIPLLFHIINYCLFPFSVFSVKGSRKLSLPTDLKADLGTVGKSQQL